MAKFLLAFWPDAADPFTLLGYIHRQIAGSDIQPEDAVLPCLAAHPDADIGNNQTDALSADYISLQLAESFCSMPAQLRDAELAELLQAFQSASVRCI